MSNETWAPGTIEVDINGVFTTHHHFQASTGTLGELTIPAWSQEVIYRSAGGREVLMHKTSWLNRSYEMLDGELVRGRAAYHGLFSHDIAIQFDDQDYMLQSLGLLSRDWKLVDAGGITMMEIWLHGILRQGVYVTVEAAIDSDLAVFAYYLFHMQQQEQAVTTVAATGALAS